MVILLWILILCIPTFIYIAQPILRHDKTKTTLDDSEILVKAVDREQYYGALVDLEEDHEVGKISSEDYDQLKKLLLLETAEILQNLDSKTKEKEPIDDSQIVLAETIFAEAEIEIEKYKKNK